MDFAQFAQMKEELVAEVERNKDKFPDFNRVVQDIVAVVTEEELNLLGQVVENIVDCGDPSL